MIKEMGLLEFGRDHVPSESVHFSEDIQESEIIIKKSTYKILFIK